MPERLEGCFGHGAVAVEGADDFEDLYTFVHLLLQGLEVELIKFLLLHNLFERGVALSVARCMIQQSTQNFQDFGV